MVKTRRMLMQEVQVLKARCTCGASETRKKLRERVSRLAEERNKLAEEMKDANVRTKQLLLECNLLRQQLVDAQTAAQSHGASADASTDGGDHG